MASRLFRTDLQTKLKKDMQEKLDKERMQRDFPFHPQINDWNYTGREDVLSHLQHKESQRLHKIAMMQQQRVMELQQSVVPTPSISPYSKSLTFDQPVHLRLYSIAANRPQTAPEEVTRSPRTTRVMADFAKVISINQCASISFVLPVLLPFSLHPTPLLLVEERALS